MTICGWRKQPEGRDGDGQRGGSREHWPGCTCSKSEGEKVLRGREKEEVNSCTERTEEES